MHADVVLACHLVERGVFLHCSKLICISWHNVYIKDILTKVQLTNPVQLTRIRSTFKALLQISPEYKQAKNALQNLLGWCNHAFSNSASKTNTTKWAPPQFK